MSLTDIGESGVLDSDETYLIELFPLDRTVSPPTVQPIYLATRDVQFSASDPYAPSVEYDGRVTQALSYTRELWKDGLIGGGSIPAYGSITVSVDDDLVDDGIYAAWRGYAWDGRQVRILRGRIDDDEYADFEVLLDGLLSGANTFGANEISIGLSDLTARLERPVHTVTYAGTGGFEGTVELAGVDKPWAVGMFRGVEPQALGDPADLWYDVDPINGLDPSVTPVIEDGGVPFNIVGSNPPGSTNAYVDYVNGRIRLGTAPTSTLTVAAKSAFGAVGSPTFGMETAADIIETLLLNNLGFSAGELDAASFTALGSANTHVLGGWWANAPRGVEVLDALINSAAGYYTTSRGGLLTVGVWSAPTASAETDSQIVFIVTDTDIVTNSLTVEPIGVPPYRVDIGYARAHTVLDTGQFNGAATEARRAFLSREYRYATDSSAATLDEHLLSEPLIRDTMHDTESGGQALATLMSGLFAVPGRERVRFKLQLRPFAINPGDEIWIQSDQYDIDAPWRVTSIGDDAANPVVDIAAWR